MDVDELSSLPALLDARLALLATIDTPSLFLRLFPSLRRAVSNLSLSPRQRPRSFPLPSYSFSHDGRLRSLGQLALSRCVSPPSLISFAFSLSSFASLPLS
jgi:hypothetical protein